MAGAVSLYLQQNKNIVDTLAGNPLFTSLGVVQHDGMVDLDMLRDALKGEIKKAGFMRLSIPMIGDIDFTPEDVDTLYKYITEANTSNTLPTNTVNVLSNNLGGGVY
jgi:hypothetical protein